MCSAPERDPIIMLVIDIIPAEPAWPRMTLPEQKSSTLAIGATDHFHQLGDLAALLGLVARGDRAFDAMGDMIAQDDFFRPSQRRTHGRDLGDDIDAIAIVLDHPPKASDLTLDAFEPLE
jgi:hypothetical protein